MLLTGYFNINPPSTGKICPVINDASSLSKNSIAEAISSGLPILFIILKSVVQLGSSPVLFDSGVSISPGAIAFTLTSGSSKYRAKDLVKDIMPALVAEYITPYGSPIIPSTEDTATIAPFWEGFFF